MQETPCSSLLITHTIRLFFLNYFFVSELVFAAPVAVRCCKPHGTMPSRVNQAACPPLDPRGAMRETLSVYLGANFLGLEGLFAFQEIFPSHPPTWLVGSVNHDPSPIPHHNKPSSNNAALSPATTSCSLEYAVSFPLLSLPVPILPSIYSTELYIVRANLSTAQ